MAEQDLPVRRRVALKIIKPGMDTKQVVARFEQERQALAMMDHPNIAKVLDAGATEWGRPFFVMELVRGIKITEYCDQANLPTAERLKLFIQTCNAIQHAHQKGIIHRDIKPSNVLVTLQDGLAVPKVIDFGVAKATQSSLLTDKTFFTQLEQMIGTPLYMSPEQAEMSGLDIDTRSDIYSLGVLLYELLTGRTPFDPQELMRKGYDEIRRVIREQEPKIPSALVDSMPAEDRTTIAQRRQANPARLTSLLRGDLDWIVMKAMEKDRTRRYETANGLAKDIERHLRDEPVHARRATGFYRIRRAVRRHKAAFAAGSAIAAALVLGTAVSIWQALRANAAEQAARHDRDLANDARQQTETINRFLTEDLLGQATPDQNDRQRGISLEEALDGASERLEKKTAMAPEIEASLRLALGKTYFKLGKLEAAERHLRRAVNLRRELFGLRNRDTLEAQEALAWFLIGGLRNFTEGVQLSRETWLTRRDVLGPEDPATLDSMDTYGSALQNDGKPEEAEAMLKECYVSRERVLGPNNQDTLTTLVNLGFIYVENGRWTEAETVNRKVIERRKSSQTKLEAEYFAAYGNLGIALSGQERFEEAQKLFTDAISDSAKTCGPTHPYTLNLQFHLANVLVYKKEWAQAEQLAKETLNIRRVVTPAQDWIGRTLLVLGLAQMERGDLDEAERSLNEACSLFREKYPSKKALSANAENLLGTIQFRRKNYSAAEKLLISSAEPILSARGISELNRRNAIGHLLELFDALGNVDERSKWAKRLEEACAAAPR
jgi:tetratricopeptide (TPR) repeat protein